MPIEPGHQLLHYRIVEKLGEGGMGVVWRATDTTLDRQVAIKVLPAALAGDPDRLARFEREAKLLATVNHPGIASIYSVHEAPSATDPVRFIAMELVEGEELAARMARGPMPLDEAVEIARQIALAFESAHERGVVHRDLKPANVKLTPEGQVKVLDFGLAKAMDDPASPTAATGPSLSPTMTSAGTVAGMILGTAAYMSPEQAKGEPVDRRADIWAFGVMLYEMLTGARLYDKKTVSESLAAVLLQEPDWDPLPAGTPRSIDRLLRRCLTKDPRARLRDIGEARFTLEALQQGDVASEIDLAAPEAVPTAQRKIWPAALLVAGLLVGFAFAWFLLPARTTAATNAPLHLSLIPPEGVEEMTNAIVSPDGRRVVYQGSGPGFGRLYIRDLATGVTDAIRGTDGASGAFFSPDGRAVGFRGGGMLKTATLDGGDPVDVTELGMVYPGAAWLDDGTILYSPGWLTGLVRVPSTGGKPQIVTVPNAEAGEFGHWWPVPLPDGRHVLFTVWPAGAGLNDAYTAVLDLETGKWTTLLQGARTLFAAPDRLLFYRAGAYQSIGFDPSSLQLVGEATPSNLPIEKQYPHGSSRQPVAVGPQDMLVYIPGTSLFPLRRAVWIDRSGKIEPIGGEDRAIFSLALSPDDRAMATAEFVGGRFVIVVYDLERGLREQLRLDGSAFTPRWLPDGARLSYNVLRHGNFDIYSARRDGSDEQLVLAEAQDEEPNDWFSDGKRLLVTTSIDGGAEALIVHDLDGGEPVTVMSGMAKGTGESLSPDDAWVAFADGSSGRNEVYVQHVEGAGPRVRVSSRGGAEPLWCPTSNELFFYRGGEVIAVTYTATADRFVAGEERLLFRVSNILGSVDRSWDVSQDCRRFVILQPGADTPSRPELRVVYGWSGGP